MVNITFYKFTKEYNSTKRPTGGTSFNCEIKKGSGLMNPAIVLNIGLANAPDYNYCYIPDFNRYYFVSEWYFDTGFWTASLQCDVLATYRNEIGDSNLYALRSAVNYDGRIVDSFYPSKEGCTYSTVNITQLWNPLNSGLFAGTYVVGIVNKNADFGSLRYYLLGAGTLRGMTQYLLSNSLLSDNGFDPAYAVLELQKSLVDPMQYIKSCHYIPLNTDQIGREHFDFDDLYVFDWEIMHSSGVSYTAGYVKPENPVVTLTRNITLPKHPQTSARGQFVNLSPYTNLFLHIPPFGMIELDTTVTSNATTLNIEIELDLPSGMGILEVKCNGIVLNSVTAQVGVPIQLSQVTRDYIGGVTSIMGGVTSTLLNTVTGNVGGAIMSAASGVANAVDSMVPRATSMGTGGSYSQLYSDQPKLYAQFFNIVDDDLTKNGRPCCKVIKPKNNAGYLLIQDGDVAINGTRDEAELIRNYLESGFYWE